jgi:hypothetical protein
MRTLQTLLVIASTAFATSAAAAPATALRVTLPSFVIAGQPFSMTVEAMDDNGSVDTNYAGSVTFSSNDLIATPPSDYTYTPTDAGVQEFTATLRWYGPGREISVADAAHPEISGSGSTFVKYGPDATQRFHIAAPDDVSLGVSFTFALIATDFDGNPVSDYTGTVHFDSHGVVSPADTTFTLADGGMKVFTATPDRGGWVILGVRDVAYPAIGGSKGMTAACPGFTVTASHDGPACPGERPTLTATTSASGVTFEWTGPPVYSRFGPVVLGIPNWGGTYFVTISHPNGCTASDQIKVPLNAAFPEITASARGSLCEGSERTYTITDTASNGPYGNIMWSVENGEIVAGQGTESVTIRTDHDDSGPAFQFTRVYLAATNGAGCAIENRRADEFIIDRRPVATIPSSTEATCFGATVSIPVALSGTAPFAIFWSDGHVDRGIDVSTFTRVVTATASNSYSITAMEDAHCSGSGSGSVQVLTGVTPQITRQPQSAIVDRGARHTLTVELGLEDVEVQWYRGLSGDRSNPVPGATSLHFQTPPIEQTTSYWAEITTFCGTVLSEEATLRIRGRRRAAGHP